MCKGMIKMECWRRLLNEGTETLLAFPLPNLSLTIAPVPQNPIFFGVCFYINHAESAEDSSHGTLQPSPPSDVYIWLNKKKKKKYKSWNLQNKLCQCNKRRLAEMIRDSKQTIFQEAVGKKG